MTYQQTLEYLYTRLPMFQRIGAAAYKANLDNTWAICSALGNPQNHWQALHVAGTNGKGSSSHLLAAILMSAGYRVGLYTSPHLKNFTERIRVNGQEMQPEKVVAFVERNKDLIERISPSFFELTVGMAFEHFKQENVAVAVIEVGLGGRLDSTNVIEPILSLITNISYDHQNLFGETLPLIANEKAGIIKHQTPVVISQEQPEVSSVFSLKAQAQQAPIYFASQRYQAKWKPNGKMSVLQANKLWLDDLECELKGLYQEQNVCGVLQAVEQLNGMGFGISQAAVRNGIANVVSLTGLKGRRQQLQTKPLVIADTAHNPDGISQVFKQVKSLAFAQLRIVFGTVNDKDFRKVLALLPTDATYYFCQPAIPRALPAHELAQAAQTFGLKGEVEPDVNQALGRAIAASQPQDLVVVVGSTFVVAELATL